MSKAPIRTLTVCSGRETLGFIEEHGRHDFTACLMDGKTLGQFPTTGDAAQAINAAHIATVKPEGSVH
jgi:hypothetical protein